MRSDLRRNLGLGGLLFVALFVVSGVIVSTPASDASLTTIATKFADHRTGFLVQAYVIGVAVVVGLAFFWYLRELLAETDSTRRLATIGFAGAILFAVSGATAAGTQYAIYDVAKKATPSTLQILNLLESDITSVMAAGGVAAFLLATGIAVTRSAALPSWLGWLGVLLGVASLALPFISPLGAPVWVLIASIVLLATKGPAVAADPALAAAA